MRLSHHLCKLKDNDENVSSHDVLIATFNIPKGQTPLKQIDYSNSYEDFVVERPIWNRGNLLGYQQQASSEIKNILEQFPDHHFVPEVTELISNSLIHAAKLNF